ncbi:MAG: glycosyltransferase family 2 protein [Cyanobacteria bacterium J06650_10]
MLSPKVICITPIKNEAWILERFLKCSSIWADHIIIADQNSTDDSREIARKFPKVILIENNSDDFNEPERQKLLIEEARKIKGDRILIALDADECLTGNFQSSPEWNTVITATPGTVINFQWINLLSDMEHCWIPAEDRAFGFIDDGISEHIGRAIHSQRVPIPAQAPTLLLKQIKVLHYQYTDWTRMQSKHRWYQMWENINYPGKSSISIYRRYNHMYPASQKNLFRVRGHWLKSYIRAGIDMTSTSISSASYWWDKEAICLLEKYTPKYFRTINIWDCPWKNISSEDSLLVKDPRSIADKILHIWLRKTQAFLHEEHSTGAHWIHYILRLSVRTTDKVLMLLGF